MSSKSMALLKSLLANGGDQNFLGARWVPAALGKAPAQLRRPLALWLLSWSPHYFYSPDREAEAERNRVSREHLVRDLLLPHLHEDLDVLDYGCGPGYMARAVAPRVRRVYALDISRGTLACARVLNPADNIRYGTPSDFSADPAQVDLAYSFAVAQHLTDKTLRHVLASISAWLRPGGRLYMHIVVDAPGWRDEETWRADSSLIGRLRMRHGLRCFTRSRAATCAMATAAGLIDVDVTPLVGRTSGDHDIATQHLLTARRPRVETTAG